MHLSLSAPLGSPARETERLAHVYADYLSDTAILARWDAQNPGNAAIARERQNAIRSMLSAQNLLPLANHRVLEVGCGSGAVLASMEEFGADRKNLYGIDLLSNRISHTARRFPELHFQVANAEALPFPGTTFDLVVISTVFSSILDQEMAANAAAEVWRVLRPGGAVLWYDFRYNNPRNPHVRGMTRAKISALFPDFKTYLWTLTLLPPLARRLGLLTPVLYKPLAALPPLRTHYLGLLIKY